MDTPIKPRTVKPRVRIVYSTFPRQIKSKIPIEVMRRWYTPDYFICSDSTVAAKGWTIHGAYKNWVSLCIDRCR